jgi:hypothetical protein
MHTIIDTMHTAKVRDTYNYLTINVGGHYVHGSDVAELQSRYNALKATANIKGQKASIYRTVNGVGKFVRSEIVA